MTSASSITTANLLQQFGGLVGTTGRPEFVDVTSARVLEFMRAVDPQTRTPASLSDDDVPLSFLFPDPIIIAARMGLPRPRPFDSTIDGGTEWEMFTSPRLGTVVRLDGLVAGVSAKPGSARTGPMLFTVFEITATAPEGVRIGVARGTSISYRGSE
ncbi:hypothetical protein [Microbacterium ulmi]|uniref:N-terminal of MaoC-like dehydratase domain-containing protein n=1 Tax=Microbacterium ulmi TaxID=179095 RepID=A0A7Y2M169_9MICO|nr:hypothetical protein [Microbacterium ulmi]NII69832.1 hypothetical protein [Microbacterium ulmi]NNH03198.1 hypothetical protein [Microbacterium ulmi]